MDPNTTTPPPAAAPPAAAPPAAAPPAAAPPAAAPPAAAPPAAAPPAAAPPAAPPAEPGNVDALLSKDKADLVGMVIRYRQENGERRVAASAAETKSAGLELQLTNALTALDAQKVRADKYKTAAQTAKVSADASVLAYEKGMIDTQVNALADRLGVSEEMREIMMPGLRIKAAEVLSVVKDEKGVRVEGSMKTLVESLPKGFGEGIDPLDSQSAGAGSGKKTSLAHGKRTLHQQVQADFATVVDRK